MRIWFDAEFIEDGVTIDLLSIGMVREDGATLYYESRDCDQSKASPWVVENVFPHLQGGEHIMSRNYIARKILEFVGEKPEFWAWYGAYDWVALCQLYGSMVSLARHWPFFCRDVKQMCMDRGDPTLPVQESMKHHALADALWTWKAWKHLEPMPIVGKATPPVKFHVGERVWKCTGDYRGPGIVRGHAFLPGNKVRYLVGHQISDGKGEFLHVYAEGNLEKD